MIIAKYKFTLMDYVNHVIPGGLARYAFIIETNSGQTIHSEYGLAAKPFTDGSTNNVAEHTGIIKALE